MINISGPPKLNVPPRFQSEAFFNKGENVVIKIPFVGHPKPKITWYKDTEHIESGGHYTVETKVCMMAKLGYLTFLNNFIQYLLDS